MENENREYILRVYGALQEKGYNAVGQIVGYLLTEDPTYITNHLDARRLIRKIDRYGLLADIVANDGGKSISCVPTAECLEHTIREYKAMETGFICTNVQETDLAGHSQSSKTYKEILEIADGGIGQLKSMLTEDDILLVMADHGNDPDIGHSKHTRECVPLLLYKKGVHGKKLGKRASLSDVGASVCDYFHVKAPENGKSFLDRLGAAD